MRHRVLVALFAATSFAAIPAAKQQTSTAQQQTGTAPQPGTPTQTPASSAKPPQGPAPAATPAAVPATSPTGQTPPASSPQAQAERQRPAFRAGVEVVSLNVTVTDGANHYVTDLEPTDFSVFEDGVKQDVSFFNRRQQPIALSLLLDSSASMEDKLSTLQTAAANFVSRLKANDIAQIIDFDSVVQIRQAFTGNQSELTSAIGHMSAGGSTSLHNAIYIALKELRKIKAVSEEDVRRQALIVFSDGEDTSSLVSFEEVLDLAKRSETAVYTIALRGFDTQSRGFREAEFVMRQMAQETGGRSFFPARVEDLDGVYSQIADELASQYTIGFTSKNAKRDGAWRRLVVQVARPNVTPRTKRGYYAPTAR